MCRHSLYICIFIGTYKSLSELNKEYRLVDMQQTGNMLINRIDGLGFFLSTLSLHANFRFTNFFITIIITGVVVI